MTSTDALVGRRAELDLLRGTLADARAGAGHLVLVSGPAGIGKTRLVEELAAEGTRVGWGAAVADAGMPALWPWVRAVRELPGPRAAVAALVAGTAQREYGSAEESSAAFFAGDTAVLDALGECARAEPGLLVVLDDLQWADRATLRLLDRVAAEVRRLPLLVVGAHRDGAELRTHRAAEVIGLGPLSSGESAVMLSTAVDGADPAAVRRATELSGGSPLFLRTLAKVAADALRGQAAWADAVGADPGLRHLVTAAMEAAGPDAAAAVEALSVLGPDTEPEIVARLLGVASPSAAIERLLPAVPAGLVEIAANDQIRFAHVLVRDAAYASLQPSRRAALHRAAAELLEPLAVGRDERAGAVARHWHRAGTPGNAVPWAIRAADAARAAGAYEESASYVRLALDAGVPDRAELLLDLARVQYLAGHLVESAETCVRAGEEGERTGRGEIVGRAAIIVQGVGHPVANRLLEDLCRRALRLLGDGASAALRARVEAQLACVLFELDADEEAASHSHNALELAAASGDPNAELDAIRARASLEWRPRLNDEMAELGRRAVELAEPTGRPLARLWGHIWLSDSAVHRADMAGAVREVDAMQALADRTGLPLVRWHLLRRKASLAALTGDFEGFRRLRAQAGGVAADWEDKSVQFTDLAQSIGIAVLRGDLAELIPGWQRHLPDIRGHSPVVQAGIACALLLAGRRDEALALYQPIVRSVKELKRGTGTAMLAYMPDLAPELGGPADCRVVREALREMFGESDVMGMGTVWYHGSAARVLGELDLGCGEPDVAVPHFEAGMRIDTQLGARPNVARGRLGLARALAETGERRRAVELARAAAAEARRLDMPGLLRAADTFLAEVAARTDDPLTPREREIADLVAQALTNRAIADKLVLSERTVESHVRRILAKTGLTTRTELARWFLQQ